MASGFVPKRYHMGWVLEVWKGNRDAQGWAGWYHSSAGGGGWHLVRALKRKFNFETRGEQGGYSYLGINGPNEISESVKIQNYAHTYITYVYMLHVCVHFVYMCVKIHRYIRCSIHVVNIFWNQFLGMVSHFLHFNSFMRNICSNVQTKHLARVIPWHFPFASMSFRNAVMHSLTTGIHSEKCTLGQLYLCGTSQGRCPYTDLVLQPRHTRAI